MSNISLHHEETLWMSSETGTCIFCRNVALINSEISNTITKMESLMERKKDLNRGLGRLCHRSLVHRMPPEIIANIFEIYVKDWVATKSNVSGPLCLGAICRPWRELAWAKPGLWTNVDFEFGPEVSFNSFQIAWDWLSRTENLPLSVRLSQRKDTDDFPRICQTFVQNILRQYGPRCHSLSLRLPSEALASIEYFSNPGSSLLQTLEVTSTNTESVDGPTLNLGHHVSPKSLSLSHLVLSEVAIDFSKITSFTGDHMFLGEVVQILTMAPLLKSCTQRAVYFDIIFRANPLIMEPLIQLELENLDVDFCCEKRDVKRFFQKVIFPRLKNFTCVFCADYFPVKAFTDFITRSSCSLQQLSLEHVPVSGRGLIDIARAAPSITDLSISYLIEPPSSSSQSHFYDALYLQPPPAGSEAVSDSPEEVLLPMLQRLYINPGSEGFTWELIPGFIGIAGDQEFAHLRPLKEVEISCVDSYPLDSQEFNRYEVPLIRRDTLETLLRLEDVDLKLNYRTNPNASPRDIIESSVAFHEMIDRARLFGPQCLASP